MKALRKTTALAMAVVLAAAVFAGCAGSAPGGTTAEGTTAAANTTAAAAGTTAAASTSAAEGTSAATPLDEGSTTTGAAAPAGDTTAEPVLFSEPVKHHYTGYADFPITEEKSELHIWAIENILVDNMETHALNIAYEQRTNVHVNWEIVPGAEAATKFNLSIASGDLPDTYLCYDMSPAQVMMCADGGVFRPLNDLIEQYGPNTKKAFEEDPYLKDQLTAPDGNIYTLTITDAGRHMISYEKMFVLTEWMEKLGLPLPQTTAEFKDMLIAFRDLDPNGNGEKDEIPFASSATAAGNFNPLFYLVSPFQQITNKTEKFYALDEAGSPVFQANTEGFREGLRYIADLYGEGLIAPETYVQDRNMMMALASNPDPAQRIVGSSSGLFQGSFVDSAVMSYNLYEAIPPLEGPDGTRQSDGQITPLIRLRGPITTACEIPDVAMRWMDFWMSDLGYFTAYKGFDEDNSYEVRAEENLMGEDTSYVMIKDYYSDNFAWNNAIIPYVDKPYMRYNGSAADENDQNVILLKAVELYDPYVVSNNIPTIIWAGEELTTRVMEYEAAFRDYILTSTTQFIIGEMDLDADWDAYVAGLDALGLQDYMSILPEYYQ